MTTIADYYDKTFTATIDTQEINGHTFYLDTHKNGKYCICKDERPLKWFSSPEEAETCFYNLIGKQHNR